MSVEKLIIENLELWTGAVTQKSASGRGSSSKRELTGIKKLRELILELAVRGKLVPQDSSEESATLLLSKIADQVARHVKAKQIRKPKNLPEVDQAEYEFDLPAGWAWCRLNDIGEWGAGATPKRSESSYYGGEIPWFKSGELSADFIHSSEEHITQKAVQETSVRLNSPGDVLIAMYGATIGKA